MNKFDTDLDYNENQLQQILDSLKPQPEATPRIFYSLKPEVASNNFCYYCGAYINDHSCDYQLTLYKVIGRSYLHGRRVGYKQCTIPISRCQNCKKTHREHNKSFNKVPIISCLVSIAICSLFAYMYGDELVIYLFWAFLGGGILGWILGLLLNVTVFSKRFEKSHNNKIKEEFEVGNHPMVAALMEQGWSTSRPSP